MTSGGLSICPYFYTTFSRFTSQSPLNRFLTAARCAYVLTFCLELASTRQLHRWSALSVSVRTLYWPTRLAFQPARSCHDFRPASHGLSSPQLGIVSTRDSGSYDSSWNTLQGVDCSRTARHRTEEDLTYLNTRAEQQVFNVARYGLISVCTRQRSALRQYCTLHCLYWVIQKGSQASQFSAICFRVGMHYKSPPFHTVASSCYHIII